MKTLNIFLNISAENLKYLVAQVNEQVRYMRELDCILKMV
jgi:hypothetical protein